MPRGRRHRRRLRGPSTASLSLRITALLVPLTMVVTSLVWHWPDHLLEDSGVALATIQLALGSLLAWGTADAYLRTRRRRLLVSETGDTVSHDNDTLMHALHLVWKESTPRAIVVSCADEMISDVVRVLRGAAHSTGRVVIECREATVARLCGRIEPVAALALVREEFTAQVLARGFRESEAGPLWDVLLHRTDLVVAARSPGTMDAPLIGVDVLSDLSSAGLRVVWVGSSHPLGRDHDLLEFSTLSTTLAAGHLRDEEGSGHLHPLHGALPLLDILGDRAIAAESLRSKLLAASRLAGPSTSAGSYRDGAASALLLETGFFDTLEREELYRVLQFSSRGIRILSHMTEPIMKTWNPPVLNDPDAGGFLAHKRRICLDPEQLTADQIASLVATTPIPWLLDFISSMRANTAARARTLMLLAEVEKVSVRYAAAVQLIKTLSLDNPGPLLSEVEARISDEPTTDVDSNLGLGAVGWIAPRLLIEWPDVFQPTWQRLLAAAGRRDPTHLGLSISRGILLSAGDHPERAMDMVHQLRSTGPLFWLSDIKMAHAAGKIASAGVTEGRRVLDSLIESSHDLVARSAVLAQRGVQEQSPVAEWTWGLEMLESMATHHPHNADTARVLGSVVLRYGDFLDPTARGRGTATTMSDGRSLRSMLSRTTSPHLPLTFGNSHKKSELRLGAVFCLRQAHVAENAEARRMWIDAARRALSVGASGTVGHGGSGR